MPPKKPTRQAKSNYNYDEVVKKTNESKESRKDSLTVNMSKNKNGISLKYTKNEENEIRKIEKAVAKAILKKLHQKNKN